MKSMKYENKVKKTILFFNQKKVNIVLFKYRNEPFDRLLLYSLIEWLTMEKINFFSSLAFVFIFVF